MRTFMIFCLMVTTMTLSAQTEKGQFIISGQTSLGLSYSNDETSNPRGSGGTISQESYSFNVAPAFGYFVIDNLALSLQADYKLEDSDYVDKMSQFTIMPSVLYYLPTDKPVRPFASLGAGYADITQHIPISNSSTQKHSFSGFTWGAAVGAAYFLNNYVAIDLSLQYSNINTSYSSDSSMKIKQNGFAASIGFSLFL